MNNIRLKQVCTTLIFAALFVWGLLFAKESYAEGGLSLDQTRVVFDGDAKSAKVTLNNQSERVYLINSRVLMTPDGNERSTAVLPFMVTPPLFRLEKESRNTVLISRNNISGLPTDRESLFYLSFLAIPSVKKGSEEVTEKGSTTTQVSFGIRMLIKLFYRPTGFSMPVLAAPEKLTFVQQGMQLQVTNPTPYYQTLAQLTLNGQSINVREQGAMIAPFSTQTYQVKAQVHDIHWSVINDFGGLSETFHWAQ
ncbi:MAG: fimbrial biogenesis chaperone [Providencia sp.]|uniref:fimbrial biogenesis chaperone n=1 Tax=Providencia sp. TaxID=589 RepID=UPI003F9E2DA0